MIRLPGLIDPHVHFRTPGQEYKEDFLTGTSAALAGGYTTIIDMPNNLQPVTTLQKLEEKEKIAQKQIICDVGFYFGSLGENLHEFPNVQDKVLGLKMYLNQTTGNFVVDTKIFQRVCESWPVGKPILVHAEENILPNILEIAYQTNQKLHVCHVSSRIELQTIITAKEKGYKVTCGVTPHHLFLSEEDEQKLGPFGRMRPPLRSKKDVEFLWSHLDNIDIIESDHAPHTKEEKLSDKSPFGVPGLETTLPLLLTAVSQGKLTIVDIQRLCSDNPSKIFGIQQDENTKIEIDENEEWTIKNENLFTKCKWSPFDGWKVKGRVEKVVLRGSVVFEKGTLLAKPGQGRIIT